MNYEAGYYIIFKWIIIVFTILSIGLVGWNYVKRAIKHDIKLIWFWLGSMFQIVTMTSLLQLLKPVSITEVNAMLSEKNTLFLFMFCISFIITNTLWVIGVFSIAKKSISNHNERRNNM